MKNADNEAYTAYPAFAGYAVYAGRQIVKKRPVVLHNLCQKLD